MSAMYKCIEARNTAHACQWQKRNTTRTSHSSGSLNTQYNIVCLQFGCAGGE